MNIVTIVSLIIAFISLIADIILGIISILQNKKIKTLKIDLKEIINKYKIDISNDTQINQIQQPQIINNNYGCTFEDFNEFVIKYQNKILNEIATKASKKETLDVINNKLRDLNWTYSFLDNARRSDEQKIKDIWSNVLAGKNKASFKLLSFISNISSYDANLFMEILPLFCKDFLLWFDNDDGKIGQFSYATLLKLKDAGLIDISSSTSLQFKLIAKGEIVLFASENYTFLVKNNSNDEKKYYIRCYRLTEIGKELASYIEYNENSKFIIERFKKLKEEVKSKNLIVVGYKTISILNGKPAYDKRNDILL